MADIADVMDALETIVLGAAFPNGTDQPSVLPPPKKVAVGQGWPLAADLDNLVAKGTHTLVSIYAVPSSTSEAGQPFNTQDEVVSGPEIGLTITADGHDLTLAGAPKAGEYVSVETARSQAYDVTAHEGETASAVAGRLAQAIGADYPQTTVDAGTIAVRPDPPRLTVRQGSPVLMATRTHRQRTQFRISIWAPTPADRAQVAKAIDVVLKSRNTIRVPEAFPGGSQGLLTYAGTNLNDRYEDEGVYRRDIDVAVVYDTLETYPAYVVTTVGVTATLSP